MAQKTIIKLFYFGFTVIWGLRYRIRTIGMHTDVIGVRGGMPTWEQKEDQRIEHR